MSTSEQLLEPDLSGQTLDRYRLIRRLGIGGMGAVYEAEHTKLEKRVAVKVLRHELTLQEVARKRFLREAKAATRVEHPNVVAISDYGETDNGRVFFAMELLQGRDLAELVKVERRLPWERVQKILLQIVSALEAAHAKKIVHRDMKPSNCFLVDVAGMEGSDFIKVLDFGIAKVMGSAGEATESLTSTDEVLGTVGYMAPEMATGTTDDPRSDIYSVGVMMYRMLTGTLPFANGTAFQILSQHINVPPPPPRSKEPSISEDVEEIILKALEKTVELRFQSMKELAEALRRGAVAERVGRVGGAAEAEGVAAVAAVETAAVETAAGSEERGDSEKTNLFVAASLTPPTSVVARGGASVPVLATEPVRATVRLRAEEVQETELDAAREEPEHEGTEHEELDESEHEELDESEHEGPAGEESEQSGHAGAAREQSKLEEPPRRGIRFAALAVVGLAALSLAGLGMYLVGVDRDPSTMASVVEPEPSAGAQEPTQAPSSATRKAASGVGGRPVAAPKRVSEPAQPDRTPKPEADTKVATQPVADVPRNEEPKIGVSTEPAPPPPDESPKTPPHPRPPKKDEAVVAELQRSIAKECRQEGTTAVKLEGLIRTDGRVQGTMVTPRTELGRCAEQVLKRKARFARRAEMEGMPVIMVDL